jgi:polysaccharide biosynthesis protein PslG
VLLKRLLPAASLCVVALAGGWFVSSPAQIESLTGETNRFAQVRALWNLALQQTRPALALAPEQVDTRRAPRALGVNTFLEQEVEIAKRERQFEMLRAAGFRLIRQQFPWADIEIDAKGDFTDRRNASIGAISAWDKYDTIVALAEKYQIEIVARLDAPPKWAHEGYADLGTFGPAANDANYIDFVAAVAERYKGRVRFYQIWNEPNIFPEWGNQSVNPEHYTRLLCAAHARIRAIDPDAVVIAAPLAPTVAQDGRDLHDLVFLQRMYTAGARGCFDVASAQGYGLFSGPDDRRLTPLETNVARHVLMRDVMVRNGDARTPIWLAEVNWNAVPNDPARIEGVGRFGMVTDDEQARYVPRLIERAKRDWPWVSGVAVWFFKPATDANANQSMYYFRLLDPDFTPRPVYESIRRAYGDSR